ncbi:hypothetical protein [Nibribacter koreensis]|uniref:GLPGLI family protein n=1 Tax=Nibribacter koreensis TaxID=1084519 RepID=A0ABP8F5V5_9BACT
MKNIYLFICAMLFSFSGIAQTMVITNGVVSVDGQNLFKIKKTQKGNMLLQTMPEFTIYDLQDVPRLKWEGDQGTLVFLDDNKSHLPRTADAYEKSIAKFIIKDSIFTKAGYNAGYKKAWIEKYGGYYHSNKAVTYDNKGLIVRDKSKSVETLENKILQDGLIIGTLSNHTVPGNEGRRELRVFNSKEENVLRAFYDWSSSMNQGGDFKIEMNLVKEKETDELKVTGVNNLNKKILEYLVVKGYL